MAGDGQFMNPSTSVDELSPAVKRDLFFSDLAATRRQILQGGVLVIGLTAVCVARIFVFGDASWNAWLSFASASLSLIALATNGVWRRREGTLHLAPDTPVGKWRGLKALDQLLAEGEHDPDVASDGRMAGELIRTRRVRLMVRGVLAACFGLSTIALVVVLRTNASPVQGFFRPTPSAVELVDVLLVPPSADFHSLISVDVTRGQVTQIAPYVTQRSGRVPELRAFEAVGKFLVAGDAIDFSTPGWLGRFKTTWMRPIDIGTSGDFLVLDVDPRSHDVTQDQIAAAVVGGKYYTRQDIRAKAQ